MVMRRRAGLARQLGMGKRSARPSNGAVSRQVNLQD